jgi:predicted DNA-binding transcriptional regulator AlpA
MVRNRQIQSYPVFTPPSKVNRICGISRSTALRLESTGQFPQRRRITPGGLTAWRTDELLDWAEAREKVR